MPAQRYGGQRRQLEQGFPLSPGCGATAFADFASVGVTQINFLVPRATPTGRVPFRVEVAGQTTFEGTLNIFVISPGLLSISPADPLTPGAIRNQDGTVNGPNNRAARGEVIEIFGVGADFAALPEDGSPAPSDTLIRTETTPTVHVSVVEAEVQWPRAHACQRLAIERLRHPRGSFPGSNCWTGSEPKSTIPLTGLWMPVFIGCARSCGTTFPSPDGSIPCAESGTPSIPNGTKPRTGKAVSEPPAPRLPVS